MIPVTFTFRHSSVDMNRGNVNTSTDNVLEWIKNEKESVYGLYNNRGVFDTTHGESINGKNI